MWNLLPILLVAALTVPFRSLRTESVPGPVKTDSVAAAFCLTDSDSACEPEVEDGEWYFDNHGMSVAFARWGGSVACQRCRFVAEAEIDPLTSLPPPQQ